MKIKFNKKKCIGCGACTAFAPNHFKLNNEGKVDLKKDKVTKEDIKKLKQAEQNCPMQIIEIEEN